MGIFKEKPKDEEAGKIEPVVDSAEPEEVANEEKPRSVYNCTNCKGEGLEYEGVQAKLCSKCNGTGKVN